MYKKILTRKEVLFLAELGDILRKYDAVLQCGASGNVEVLVFDTEPEPEESFRPIRFSGCMDETDIRKLFVRNEAAMKVSGNKPEYPPGRPKSDQDHP